MHVTYLGSAALLVETEAIEILCDPWLMDGAFFGAWSQEEPDIYERGLYNCLGAFSAWTPRTDR